MHKTEPSLTHMDPMLAAPSYRIGVLLYARDVEGRLLLIRRTRRPNQGAWCAVGGKLEMPLGESPYECAVREAREELGVVVDAKDLRLRCLLSEREYEGTGHWLMFVFEMQRRLNALPQAIDEGEFGFFEIDELESIEMPLLDRTVFRERILKSDSGLHVLRIDERAVSDPSLLVEEERIPSSNA